MPQANGHPRTSRGERHAVSDQEFGCPRRRNLDELVEDLGAVRWPPWKEHPVVERPPQQDTPQPRRSLGTAEVSFKEDIFATC